MKRIGYRKINEKELINHSLTRSMQWTGKCPPLILSLYLID